VRGNQRSAEHVAGQNQYINQYRGFVFASDTACSARWKCNCKFATRKRPQALCLQSKYGVDPKCILHSREPPVVNAIGPAKPHACSPLVAVYSLKLFQRIVVARARPGYVRQQASVNNSSEARSASRPLKVTLVKALNNAHACMLEQIMRFSRAACAITATINTSHLQQAHRLDWCLEIAAGDSERAAALAREASACRFTQFFMETRASTAAAQTSTTKTLERDTRYLDVCTACTANGGLKCYQLCHRRRAAPSSAQFAATNAPATNAPARNVAGLRSESLFCPFSASVATRASHACSPAHQVVTFSLAWRTQLRRCTSLPETARSMRVQSTATVSNLEHRASKCKKSNTAALFPMELPMVPAQSACRLCAPGNPRTGRSHLRRSRFCQCTAALDASLGTVARTSCS
jgi:hypothetical protein